MRQQRKRVLCIGLLVVLAVNIGGGLALGEDIDPDSDGSQYAYGENVGWINAEPSGNGGPGVQVDDFQLSGWMWGENLGWISLSCQNTASCTTVDYGVVNDGAGKLSGFAWAENAGWINFDPSTSDVSISPNNGNFSGRAWGENIGWITLAATSPVAYKVKTDWCQSTPTPPSGTPALSLAPSGANTQLSWTALAPADWYELVKGSLSVLRSTGGDFAAATDQCVADNVTGTSGVFAGSPAPNDGFWFLVRGVNCKGKGPYDSGGSGQVGSRDGAIVASGGDCP